MASYIRKGKYRPATTTATTAAVSRSRDPPPWFLKHGELECSGRRLSSLNGRTKRIAYFFYLFFSKKNIFSKVSDFFGEKNWFFEIFPEFFLGLGWTGELWSNFYFLKFLIFFNFFLFYFQSYQGYYKKIMAVTSEHQKWPKISTNSEKSRFLPKGQIKARPKAEAIRRSWK